MTHDNTRTGTLDLMEALQACEEKMLPTPIERLMQIILRLGLHYRADMHDTETQSRWIGALAHYPEDVLCAAYIHLVKQMHSVPTPDDFVAFIEPEMQYRQLQRAALKHALEEAEKTEAA